MALEGSEPERYPQFPATGFDPMGTYEPPIRMNASSRTFYGYGEGGAPVYVENASAASTKFAGYRKDGSPIFLENVSAKAYLGNRKDGSPIFVNASEGDINPLNILATAAICGAGLAFGWLIANSARNIIR